MLPIVSFRYGYREAVLGGMRDGRRWRICQRGAILRTGPVTAAEQPSSGSECPSYAIIELPSNIVAVVVSRLQVPAGRWLQLHLQYIIFGLILDWDNRPSQSGANLGIAFVARMVRCSDCWNVPNDQVTFFSITVHRQRPLRTRTHRNRV